MTASSSRFEASPKTIVERLRLRLARLPFPVVVGLASCLWFGLVGARTPLDEDEGFYALAGELVAHGHVPYRDFFYPQTPMGALVIAPFAAIGPRYLFLRLVSAAFAAVVAGLVAHAVMRETRSRAATVLAVLLFATHELTWRWLPTLRPYAFGEACALGAFLLATPLARKPTTRELVLAGGLAALAPLARLPLAPTIGIIALAILLRGRKDSLLRGACAFAVIAVGASIVKHPAIAAIGATAIACAIVTVGRGGRAAIGRVAWLGAGVAAVVLLVMGPLALMAKESLLFGVIDYHSETSRIVGWPQSRALLGATLGGGAITELSAMGAQNVLLLVANLVALSLRRPGLRLASLTGVTVIAIGSARHEPAVEHYITPIVPYLAIGAGITFGALERVARGRLVGQRRALQGGVLAVFVLAGAASFQRTWIEGMQGPWSFAQVRPIATDETLAAIDEVARANPGPLLSYWPGSGLGNATHVLPGFENQFARRVAGSRTADKRAALHLAGEDDLRAAVTGRTPSVVIIDRGIGLGREPFEALLTASRYAKNRVVGPVTIYVRLP